MQSHLIRPLLLSFAVIGPLASAHENPAATSPNATDIGTVNVDDAGRRSHSGLSPITGGSKFTMTQSDINQLPLGASTPLNQVLLQAPGVAQDSYGDVHVRGDHGNVQYRINGMILPQVLSGFGQVIDTRIVKKVQLLDGTLPAQYGEHTAAVVDITTKDLLTQKDGGTIGVTGGSQDTINPFASWWGHSQRWGWFVTGNTLGSNDGIENPTSSKTPIHDDTRQNKAFADISFSVDENTQLGLAFGVANSHFQIPNAPDIPENYVYGTQSTFQSTKLDERQRQNVDFAAFSVQGLINDTTYQASFGTHKNKIVFTPDLVGDLIFNGVASNVDLDGRTNTAQVDFSTLVHDSHLLSYGVYLDSSTTDSQNLSWVFPANASGEQSDTQPIHITDIARTRTRDAAIYIQDTWAITKNFTLHSGIRANRLWSTDNDEGQVSPRLSMNWQITSKVSLHAGYARYFMPPTNESIRSSDIASYAGTTNQQAYSGSLIPLSDRSHYYDVGMLFNATSHTTLGVDTYLRKAHRLQDEGQLGSTRIYSTFNYDQGLIRGIEFTADYQNGPISAGINAAASKAIGKKVITGSFNFDPDELVYIANHWIFLDHDQRLTSSGHITYTFASHSHIGAQYVFGSGLRTDTDTVPNGAKMPSYFQLNLNAGHDFTGFRQQPLRAQVAIINVLDRRYELHDGGGIGVLAPQWGPRRGIFLTLQQDF